MANIFANLCGKGAENKHIPYIFENLPKKKLETLVNAIFKGDGHINLKRYKKARPGDRSITTISPILAFQLRELLLKLGYEPGIYKKNAFKDKNGINHKNSFTILWRNDLTSHHTSFWEDANRVKFWLLPIREIRKQNFQGKVYNFTVNKDHSYVANSFVVANCGKGGDVFKFLMEYENMTFIEALKYLADKAGIKLLSLKPSSQQQERDKLLAINHLTAEFYHYILLNHPVGKQGLNYLLNRGIGKVSIQSFKLGYAPNNWDTLLNYLGKKKSYQPNDLEKVGLIIKRASSIQYPASRPISGQVDINNYYDRFRGRIIFPLTDQRSNILGFSGRTIKQEVKEAKYINSPETILYHKSDLLYGLSVTKEHIKKKDQAVIVEGELDVISSYQAGTRNVVAIKGSALTEPQVNLIKRFSNTIILALDADVAGDAAVRRGIEIADTTGLNIRVTQPLYGKDPDECARHSASLWKESVEKAIPIFDFYLESAIKRFDASGPEGKKKISEELVPILAKITNEVIKAHYLKKLANILEVDEQAVVKEISRWQRTKQIGSFKAAVNPVISKKNIIKPRREMLEEFLLSLFLQFEGDIKQLIEQINIDHFNNEVIKKIWQIIKKYLTNHERLVVKELAKMIPEELLETFDRLYLQDWQDLIKDEQLYLREWNKGLKDLERYLLKDQLNLLLQEIRDKERATGSYNLNDLKAQFTVLSTRLKELSE